MIRMWVGARGAMSRKATTRSSAWSQVGRDLAGGDPAEQAADRRPRDIVTGAHQSTGFELIRKPMVPTSPAITYET